MSLEKYGLTKVKASQMKPAHYEFESIDGDGAVYRGSLFDEMVKEKIESAVDTSGQNWPNIGILVQDDESVEHELLHRALVVERGGVAPEIEDFRRSLQHLDSPCFPDNADIIFSSDFSDKYEFDFEQSWVVRANDTETYELLTEAAETEFWEVIRPHYTENIEFSTLVEPKRTRKYDEFLAMYLTPDDNDISSDTLSDYNLEDQMYLVEDSIRRLEYSSENMSQLVSNFARLENVGVETTEELIEFCMKLPIAEDLNELEGHLFVDNGQRKLSEYGVVPSSYS